MKIGEVIRKHRKEKQWTQEELAEYLGITSSAVNKWENGYSLPDIALLAPIARVFGITTDTLLSFKEELTDQEIVRIAEEFARKGRSMEYDALFGLGMGILREYPNCDKLALNILPVLDAYRMILDVPEPENYEDQILKAYQRVLKSENAGDVKTAANFLFYKYVNQGKYDEAENTLCYFSKGDPEYKKMLAVLYKKQEKTEDAYRIYEEQVMQGYHIISEAFTGIFTLASKDGDSGRCAMITEKQEQLAHLLEMGKYHESYLKIFPALEGRDKEALLQILSEMICGIRDMMKTQESELYSHMKFGEENIKNMAFMMKKALDHDETVGFLKGEARFEKLMKELDLIL